MEVLCDSDFHFHSANVTRQNETEAKKRRHLATKATYGSRLQNVVFKNNCHDSYRSQIVIIHTEKTPYLSELIERMNRVPRRPVLLSLIINHQNLTNVNETTTCISHLFTTQ